MKKLFAFFIVVGMLMGFIFPSFAYAEACTYGEAVIALQQGNTTRGVALMTMAAKDGDQRALKYLASGPHSDKLSAIPLVTDHPVTNLSVTKQSQIALVNP